MSNNQEVYSVDNLRNDISNAALIITNFVGDWQDVDANRYVNKENLFKEYGEKLYKNSLEYFKAANDILEKSNTPQAQKVAKDIAAINKRLGEAMESIGSDLYKKAGENAYKATQAAINSKVAAGAGAAVTVAELAVAVDNAIKTGDWESVGEAASGLLGSVFGAGVGAALLVGLAVAIGSVTTLPAIVIGAAAAVGAFVGSELAKVGWRLTKDIRDDLSDALADLLEDWLDIPRSGEYHVYDPLTLDLNGNGLIDVIGTDGYKGAIFDHDGDGIATATSWVLGSDGLLVLDRNGDGMINSGRELFGDSTLLSDGSLARHGYEALAEFDGNGDSVINADDEIFDRLKVWQDKNGDGISTQDEMTSLAKLGIDGLSLAYRDINKALGKGVTIAQQGTYTKDGAKHMMADLQFEHNSIYSRYTDSLELSDAQKELPNLKGMGKLRDLREATALSGRLTEVLAQYQSATTKTAQLALLPTLISEWVNTDPTTKDESSGIVFSSSLTRTSNSGFGLTPSQAQALVNFTIDPMLQTKLNEAQHKINILDGFTGLQTKSIHITSNKHAEQILKSIDTTYHNLEQSIYNTLLSQTRLKPYLEQVALVFGDEGLAFDYSKLEALIDAKYQDDPTNAFVDLAELLVYGGIDGWVEGRVILAKLAQDAKDKGVLDGYLALLDDATAVKLATQYGSDGDDLLTAVGILHKDVLEGREGNDTLVAGTADSLLIGGAGSDTYVYKQGFGDSIIDNHDASDGRLDAINITFANRADISYERQKDSLIIHVAGEAGTITVRDMFAGDESTKHIDQIILKDGAVALSDIKTELLKGTNKDDNIIGYGSDDVINAGAGNDVVEGRGGNDVIHAGDGNNRINAGTGNDIVYLLNGSNHAYGGDGDDVLHSGVGNDKLEGGIGSDIYVLGRDFGKDEIINFNPNAQDNDVIKFTDGILLDQLDIKRIDNHLVINQKGTANSIKVTGFFEKDALGDFNIQQIIGADGNQLTTEQIKAIVMQGTAGDDRLYAYATDSRLDGREGSDKLFGNAGNDTLNGGTGNDRLEGGQDDDTLIGGADDDELWGNDGNDTLNGSAGDDRLDGGFGSDTYVFALGDGKDVIHSYDYHTNKLDSIVFGEGITPEQVTLKRDYSNLIITYSEHDQVTVQNFFDNNGVTNYRIDQIKFANGIIWTADDIKHLIAQGTAYNDDILGYDDEDDVIYGQAGNDTLYGKKGNDILHGGADRDTLYGNEGDDVLYGNEGHDTLYGNEGDDTLNGGMGNDTLKGGAGDDVYVVTQHWGQDRITESKGNNIIRFEYISPDDIMLYKDGRHLLIWQTGTDNRLVVEHYFADYDTAALTENIAGIEFDGGIRWDADVILHKVTNGGAGDDVLHGFDGDDHMTGRLGDDRLHGNKGNDTLYGNEGNDTLDGGQGDDTLYGNEGDDVLMDTQGSNTLIGGAGNDTYYIHGAVNTIIDDKEGIIHVSSNVAYIPWGFWGNTDLSGYNGMSAAEARRLAEESNFLYAKDGVKHYEFSNQNFRLGEFIYNDSTKSLMYEMRHAKYMDSSYNHLNESFNYFTLMDFDTSNSISLDNISIHVNGTPLKLTGGINDLYHDTIFTLRDFITQGIFNAYYSNDDDVIYDIKGQGFGTQNIYAQDGNDTIYLNNMNVRYEDSFGPYKRWEVKSNPVHVYAGTGNDRIITKQLNHYLEVYAEDGDDMIEIGAGMADGGNGNDTITLSYGKAYGGAGSDTITVVRSNQDNQAYYTQYQWHTQLYGNEGDDTLMGGDGNDWLEGGEGADTLIGGLGDDVYIADTLDTYFEEVEGLQGGYDTIHIASNFDLSANNFEAVTLLGDGDFSVIGDEFDNYITANDGHNYLDGKAGADTLVGGSGNDYYVVDNEADAVIEYMGGEFGIDTVEQHTDRPYLYHYDEFGNESVAAHNLLFDNVENLILKGAAKTAFGNNLDNVITLNNKDNFVNALSGNDTIIYQKGGGRDTIVSTDSLENKDSLVIHDYDASEAVFVRVTNTASNHDMLQIRFKGTNDQIMLIDYFAEQADGFDNRMDEITFTKGGNTTTLSQSEFEAKIFAQTNNHAPQVNKYPRPIKGEIGKALSITFDKDTIKDADAYDSELSYRLTLASKGADGQYEPLPDWLNFDPSTLTLTGTPPQGTVGNYQFILWAEDSFGYSAGAYVNLAIAHPTASNPTLTDPSLPVIADDTINDTKGNDTLRGTAQNNTFIYTQGQDIIVDTGGQDTLIFGGGITFNQVGSGLLMSGNDLILRVNGSTTNQVTLKDFFGSADSIIETIKFETGGQIDYKKIYELFGKEVPTKSDQSALPPAVSPDVHDDAPLTISKDNHIIGDARANKLYGTDGHDQLQGLAGADTLDGKAGHDILIGGSGNDTLIGGTGNDLYYFTKGFGKDTIVNTGGGYDNIYFDGISFNQVGSGLTKMNNDLILKVSGSTDTLTIKDFFMGKDHADIHISFKDGGSISSSQLMNLFKVNQSATHSNIHEFNKALEFSQTLMESFKTLTTDATSSVI